MKSILMPAVRFYRSWISPAKPGSCRFYPTCSAYAQEAVESHGAWKGTLLTVRRLLRCHPFHPGGVDPVPGKTVHTVRRRDGETEKMLTEKLAREEGPIG